MGGWTTYGAAELLRMSQQTQLETFVRFGGVSCVATTCSLLCKVPGEVLHEKWKARLCRGDLGLSTSAANKDDTGSLLVLETALAGTVLMPSCLERPCCREARLQKRGPQAECGQLSGQHSPAWPTVPCEWPWGLALSPACDPS